MTEELTEQQLHELEADLALLKQKLVQLLDDTEAGALPVKLKDNQGRLSRMDEMHNQSILKANRNLTTNRLRKVHAAIARLEGKTYGDCEHCGEPVNFKRLKAYPDANLCLACQSEQEQ